MTSKMFKNYLAKNNQEINDQQAKWKAALQLFFCCRIDDNANRFGLKCKFV